MRNDEYTFSPNVPLVSRETSILRLRMMADFFKRIQGAEKHQYFSQSALVQKCSASVKKLSVLALMAFSKKFNDQGLWLVPVFKNKRDFEQSALELAENPYNSDVLLTVVRRTDATLEIAYIPQATSFFEAIALYEKGSYYQEFNHFTCFVDIVDAFIFNQANYIWDLTETYKLVNDWLNLMAVPVRYHYKTGVVSNGFMLDGREVAIRMNEIASLMEMSTTESMNLLRRIFCNSFHQTSDEKKYNKKFKDEYAPINRLLATLGIRFCF